MYAAAGLLSLCCLFCSYIYYVPLARRDLVYATAMALWLCLRVLHSAASGSPHEGIVGWHHYQFFTRVPTGIAKVAYISLQGIHLELDSRQHSQSGLAAQ